MDCPTCRVALEAANQDWKCATCQGVAVGLAELRDRVPADRLAALGEAFSKARAGTRPCVRCGAPMKRATLWATTRAVALDGCESCGVIWFDAGETADLRRRLGAPGGADSPRDIAALLFGIPLLEPVPGSPRRPFATWALGATVVLTGVIAFAGDFRAAVERFGMFPEDVRAWHLPGVLSHFFLHADAYHLGGNLMYLLVFGSRVEQLVGPVRWLLLIALATATGGLLHAAFAPDPAVPLIGASGGISGILAAHAALRPRSRVRTMVFYRVIEIPAIGAFAFWIVLQLIGTAAQLTGISAVSALGHLGGAAAGLLAALPFRARARAVEAA